MNYELPMDDSETLMANAIILPESSHETERFGDEGEELLEISSVSIPLKDSPLRGFTAELEVVSQSGNRVTVIVSPTQKPLLNILKPGVRFREIEFCSPVAVFRSPCLVSRVSKREGHPGKGTYLIEITVESG